MSKGASLVQTMMAWIVSILIGLTAAIITHQLFHEIVPTVIVAAVVINGCFAVWAARNRTTELSAKEFLRDALSRKRKVMTDAKHPLTQLAKWHHRIVTCDNMNPRWVTCRLVGGIIFVTCIVLSLNLIEKQYTVAFFFGSAALGILIEFILYRLLVR